LLCTGLSLAKEDGDATLVVSVLEETLQTWELRLRATDNTGGHAVPPALRAFLWTRAPEVALEALVAWTQCHDVFRHAVASVAGTQADCETETRPQRTVGEALARLLLRSSAAPPSLLAELLSLLANTLVAAEKCRQKHLASQDAASKEDVQRILRVVVATLNDGQEAEALAASCLCKVVEEALSAVDACSPSRCNAAALKASSPKKLPIGSEVWACWAGDGCWYRARIKKVCGRHVQVTWLRPPTKTVGSICSSEYLSETGSNDTLFTELGHSAVMLVEDSIRRPVPSPAYEIPDSSWTKRLSSAEVQAQRFQKLRSLCLELEGQRKSGDIVAGQADREPPLLAAAGLVPALRNEAQERAAALRSLVVESGDDMERIQGQIATSSDAMESELVAVQEKRARVAAQVEDIRAQRAELAARCEELTAQLTAVGEELAVAEAAEAELQEREQLLHASRARVSGELAQQLQEAQDRGQLAAERRDTLERAAQASRAVEAQLATRTAALDEALAARDSLGDRERAASAACAASDAARQEALQELLECWHSAIWGPDAVALPRNPTQATALHLAHQRALEAVDEAHSTAVELGAANKGKISSSKVFESFFGFGDGEFGAVEKGSLAEHMSQAAPQYKEMREQLAKNLQRLAELEKYAPGLADSKPPEDSPQAPFAPAATQWGAGGG